MFIYLFDLESLNKAPAEPRGGWRRSFLIMTGATADFSSRNRRSEGLRMGDFLLAP